METKQQLFLIEPKFDIKRKKQNRGSVFLRESIHGSVSMGLSITNSVPVQRLDPVPASFECADGCAHPNLCGYGKAVLEEVMDNNSLQFLTMLPLFSGSEDAILSGMRAAGLHVPIHV